MSGLRPRAPRRLPLVVGVVLAGALLGLAGADGEHALELTLLGDETWWVGVVSASHRMPLGRSSAPFEIDLLGNTAGNQVQPLLVSTSGRFVCSRSRSGCGTRSTPGRTFGSSCRAW